MTHKVAIYVQHLLGAGHLVRAMSLAESLSKNNYQILLLSGGFPIDRDVKGYRFFQLPPTRATEGDFNSLIDEHHNAIDEIWRNNRRAILLAEVERFKPDLVITETFPFGRRQFRFELEPLITWVKSQSSVRLMASVRDVLQRRSDAKNRLTVDTIEQYYAGVLVHADENLFKLEASFPLSHEIENKLIYTGYIHHPATLKTHPSNEVTSNCDGKDEIIVSGGSGTVSTELIEIARLARPFSFARSRVWRLLTGRDLSLSSHSHEEGLIIEPNRPDFFTLLSRCALSVSQAGYNTTLDVMASKVRSVMIPFTGVGETEQNDRAKALESVGRVLRLATSDLSPRSLAYTIDRALEMDPVDINVDLNGAVNSARLISQKLDEWRAGCLQN